MVTIGISVERQIAEEQEDHDDDDDRRFAERLGHFLDRGADEFGRVIGDRRVDAGRQLRLDVRERLADVVDDGRADWRSASDRCR